MCTYVHEAGAKRDTGRPISRQISRVNRFSTLARNGYTNGDDPPRFPAGEGNLITRLKFRIPRHPMIRGRG